MTNDWSFILTPQFLFGTVIVGLLLGIVGTYVVRAIDRVRIALSASYRHARGEESLRIEQLTLVATSDSALYAALTAEASRLRLHQLLCFFIAFVCINALMLLAAFGGLKPGIGVLGLLLVAFLAGMAEIQYFIGLNFGNRARRLDNALRAVQRNRKLPIMD